jgi:hypothetical protein
VPDDVSGDLTVRLEMAPSAFEVKPVDTPFKVAK